MTWVSDNRDLHLRFGS